VQRRLRWRVMRDTPAESRASVGGFAS
jgi:hypothetical protein